MKHVLWARTVGEGWPKISEYSDGLLWFFSYRSWSQIIAGLSFADPRILLWTAGLLASLTLFLFRTRLRKRLAAWSRSRPAGWGSMRAVFRGMLLDLLWALPAPLVVGYAGWLIGQVGEGVDLGRAIAAGAIRLARFLYLALLVRRMFVDGSATDHLLRWPPEVRESLDWGVARLVLVAAPFNFVAAALADEGLFMNGGALLQSQHYSLGRLCFNLGVLGMLLIGRRVLRPGGPVATALGNRPHTRGPDLARVSRFAWNLVCWVALLLSIVGFYLTAHMLIENLLKIGVLTLFLALISGLIRAWRFDHRQEISASSSHDDEERTRKADQQVRKLTYFGLTLVWIGGVLVLSSAALPALSFVKNVELLPEFRMVSDRKPALKAETPENPPTAPAAAPIPTPPKTPQTVPQHRPLYLSDLLLAIFVGILISMLVGNIPGLLRFTLFRRFNLDQGGEYAVNTIARYLVILVGILAVSGILGFRWSSIQWLAAALTFGIGFGLQEIFANFASGLILLLDRSVRVGDAVTVGDSSGIVTKIHMRATTVTLWNNSDMVVPNKEFITAKLVNWTLHPDTRVDVKVGVAYDSDVKQVRDVLLRLAHEHPAVHRSPPPQVLLREFGQSAILFELRVFALYSYGPPVLLDELHQGVVREFRRLGIVIAFPRLDVNVTPALAAATAQNSGAGSLACVPTSSVGTPAEGRS